MIRAANKPVWMLAAWAALAAQAALPAVGSSCDRPCCGARAVESHAAAKATAGEPSGGCPLCVAPVTHGDCCPVDSSAPPCRCQLDSRHEQPIVPPTGGHAPFDAAAEAAVPATVVQAEPQGLGVSREHLAATLAIPIRPARILFGVWRN